MKRRVVITGLGVISPIGNGCTAFWQSLISGHSGIRAISRFDASGLPVRIAGEITDFALEDYSPAPIEYLTSNGTRLKFDLRTQYAIAAAELAVREAALTASQLAEACLYFGSGEGPNDLEWLAQLLSPYALSEGCDTARLLSEARDPSFALHDQLMEATIPASVIASRFGIEGEVTTCLTACAASAQAIGEGMRRIQTGECDVALVGGAHAMTAPLDVIGFASLSALSTRNEEPTRASRPFDLRRDGFVLSEGAGALVIEEREHARRRGARIRAELLGYGLSSDAYRITDMHPEARGPIAAINAALQDAGLDPEEIGYVNAHGTSTLENDRTETLALHRAFGKAAPHIPVSSTKSMTGHMVAAAGAVELIATVLALEAQLLPPTINLEEPDPECDLDYVPNRARHHEFRFAMSNSFGFGGQNVALIIGKDGS